MRARMRGDTRDFANRGKFHASPDIHEAYFRVALSRLRKKGFVQREGRLWKITNEGRNYLTRKIFLPRHRVISPEVNKNKNMIIAFDIPERDKKKRNWLRIELVNLGFTLLQRSVWCGRAPLPVDFIHTLKRLKLLPYMKFFEAKEKDII